MQNQMAQHRVRYSQVATPCEIQCDESALVIVRYDGVNEPTFLVVIVHGPLVNRRGTESLELVIEGRYDWPPTPRLYRITKQLLVGISRHGEVDSVAYVNEILEPAVRDRLISTQRATNHEVGDGPNVVGSRFHVDHLSKPKEVPRIVSSRSTNCFPSFIHCAIIRPPFRGFHQTLEGIPLSTTCATP